MKTSGPRVITRTRGHPLFYSGKQVIYGSQQQEDAGKSTEELHFSLFLQQKMKILFKL